MDAQALIVIRNGDMHFADLGKPLTVREIFAKISPDEEAVFVVELDGMAPRELAGVFLDGLHGRRVAPSAPRADGAPAGTRPRRSTAERDESRAIREWAQSNSVKDDHGNAIGDRGRIPESVRAAYYEALGS